MSPNHNPKYKILIQRLKQARRNAGLTQAQAALRVGRPQGDISKIENNQLTLDPIELCDLARVYGQSVADLLDFIEDAEAID